MAQATESFINSGNTILQTSNKYSPKTVKGKYVTDTQDVLDLVVTELGENYIEIEEIPLNYKIIITYTIIGTLQEDNKDEYDIKERLHKLEEAVESLYEINKAYKEALNNRLNITAFNAWVKLIEKKMGIKLIEGNMNHISKELYK